MAAAYLMRASAFCFGLLAASSFAYAQGGPKGSFSGSLTFSPPCPNESGAPRFSGTVGNGRISGRAARGQSFDWALSADGRFSGEMPLRSHNLGTKVQRYKGKVSNGVVEVAATFVVPGHKDTQCTASARIPLR